MLVRKGEIMYQTISPVDIVPYDEQIVNGTLKATLERAQHLQNSSEDLRVFLARHLISEGRAEMAHYVTQCGTYLFFKKYNDVKNTITLERANFCKHPMCPLCAWRRHLKYSRIIEKTLDIGNFKYLYHLVLGVPNSETLDKKTLMRLKERGATFVSQKLKCKGYISNLEVVAHGNGIHPHLHILIETEDFIKVSKEYILEMSNKWLKHYIKGLENKATLEQKYKGLTFYIQGLGKGNAKEISQELTKYIVKGDFTNDDGQYVSTIAKAIKGVRKMSSSGTFKTTMSEAKESVSVESAERLAQLSKSRCEYLIYRFINGKFERERLY